MSYTILSATYANVDNTAALLMTEEAGAVICSAADQPVEWAALIEGPVPVAPYPNAMDDLTAYARTTRKALEVGGITLGGVAVATDGESQRKVLGAYVAASRDPNWTTVWSAADGSDHPIDTPTMLAIGDAVQAHINALFVKQSAVLAAISAGTITTPEQVDAAFARE
ncbi:DUF4376 domain-containing protein [Bosea sp. 2YAB26]|uniref:DUF4376 domain-containing protein n=1 Tax=Bosea sp. 2YAB26 TaxID=3237478 RepID=UPI003F917971